MLTYLHHSDPTIPHYRKKERTFLRGALATVDRPLLNWVGRYFLHNVSHDHVSLDFRYKCIYSGFGPLCNLPTPLSMENCSLINAHIQIAHHTNSEIPFCEFLYEDQKDITRWF